MTRLPGYTLVEPFQACGGLLFSRAIRDSDRRKVILTTPRSEHPTSRERARYEHEYSLLRRLEGTPGVITALALESFPDRPVLVLEDIDGTHLSEHVGASIRARLFLELALPLTATLAEVHRRGVIHQAIQPANILLTPSCRPWLVDFSSACLQHARPGQSAPPQLPEGMAAYMSPEQSGRMNRALDSRTDLYSLGITFYQLLTGSLPFKAREPREWIHAHLAQVPLPPHQCEPSIPLVLSAIVLKLIAKMPEERYPRAEDLLADLRSCQEALARGALDTFPLGQQGHARG